MRYQFSEKLTAARSSFQFFRIERVKMAGPQPLKQFFFTEQ